MYSKTHDVTFMSIEHLYKLLHIMALLQMYITIHHCTVPRMILIKYTQRAESIRLLSIALCQDQYIMTYWSTKQWWLEADRTTLV